MMNRHIHSFLFILIVLSFASFSSCGGQPDRVTINGSVFNPSIGADPRLDGDFDDDGILDTSDNCIITANEDQADMDEDGLGDVCDSDRDGDGFFNSQDSCPDIPNADQTLSCDMIVDLGANFAPNVDTADPEPVGLEGSWTLDVDELALTTIDGDCDSWGQTDVPEILGQITVTVSGDSCAVANEETLQQTLGSVSIYCSVQDNQIDLTYALDTDYGKFLDLLSVSYEGDLSQCSLAQTNEFILTRASQDSATLDGTFVGGAQFSGDCGGLVTPSICQYQSTKAQGTLDQ